MTEPSLLHPDDASECVCFCAWLARTHGTRTVRCSWFTHRKAHISLKDVIKVLHAKNKDWLMILPKWNYFRLTLFHFIPVFSELFLWLSTAIWPHTHKQRRCPSMLICWCCWCEMTFFLEQHVNLSSFSLATCRFRYRYLCVWRLKSLPVSPALLSTTKLHSKQICLDDFTRIEECLQTSTLKIETEIISFNNPYFRSGP